MPSSCWKLFHLPLIVMQQHVIEWSSNILDICVRYGKWVFMMYNARSLDIPLNMLRMSKEMMHLVGGLDTISSGYRVIYLSTSAHMVWYMKLDLPLTSVAQLYGANNSVKSQMLWSRMVEMSALLQLPPTANDLSFFLSCLYIDQLGSWS